MNLKSICFATALLATSSICPVYAQKNHLESCHILLRDYIGDLRKLDSVRELSDYMGDGLGRFYFPISQKCVNDFPNNSHIRLDNLQITEEIKRIGRIK